MPLAIALVAISSTACSTPSLITGSNAHLAPDQVAFVVNHALSSNPGSTITPIDLASQKPGRPVNTGNYPSVKAFSALDPSALAFSPNGKRLYVTNFGADTVSALSARTGKLTRSFKVGLEPDAIAISPSGHTGWVADFGAQALTPINLATGAAGEPVPVGSEPRALALTPNGAEVLCANFASGTVSIVNTVSRKLLATVAVGLEPTAIAITPNDSEALVADFGANVVTVVNLSTNRVSGTVALAGNPTDIVIAPGVSGAQGTVAGHGPATRSGRLAPDSNSAIAYVTAGASITPISISSDTAGIAINIVYPAEALAISNAGTVADVALQGGAVVEVDLLTGKLGHLIHVGGIPTAIAVAAPH